MAFQILDVDRIEHRTKQSPVSLFRLAQLHFRLLTLSDVAVYATVTDQMASPVEKRQGTGLQHHLTTITMQIHILQVFDRGLSCKDLFEEPLYTHHFRGNHQIEGGTTNEFLGFISQQLPATGTDVGINTPCIHFPEPVTTGFHQISEFFFARPDLLQQLSILFEQALQRTVLSGYLSRQGPHQQQAEKGPKKGQNHYCCTRVPRILQRRCIESRRRYQVEKYPACLPNLSMKSDDSVGGISQQMNILIRLPEFLLHLLFNETIQRMIDSFQPPHGEAANAPSVHGSQ